MDKLDKRIKQSLIEKIDNGEIKTYFQLKMFLDLSGLELNKSVINLFGYEYYKQSYDLFVNIILNHSDIDDYFKDNNIIKRIINIHGRHFDYNSSERFNMNMIFVPLFKRRPGILINYYLNYFENDRSACCNGDDANNFTLFEGLLLYLLHNARNLDANYQKYLDMVEKKKEIIYQNMSHMK